METGISETFRLAFVRWVWVRWSGFQTAELGWDPNWDPSNNPADVTIATLLSTPAAVIISSTFKREPRRKVKFKSV